MKFTIDLDNINNKYVVYKSGSFFVDIPYFVYGLPPVVLDEYLTVVKCSSSAFEMMYTAPDLITVQLYQFDFIGVLNKIEALLSFGFGIFEANYSDMLFWDSFTHANPYQFLDSTNFTFDAVTGLVTGLQYVNSLSFSNLYKFVLDETNSLLKVYNNDVLLVDVPFGTHSPAVVVDTFFSVPYLDGTYVDVIFAGTGLEFQNYSFDLSGIFSAIQVGTYFDVAVWDSPTYTTELFYVSKGVDGTYTPASLNETYMTFDTVSGVSSGLTYVSASATSCDLTSLTPEFDEIDLAVATLDDKLVNLHQKVDYLVTLLGQVHTLEQTLATKTDLQSITFDTSSLATKDDISVLSHYDVTNINLPSLNGNGSEFIDDVEVKVFGRDTVYTVERSFMSLYSDNGYTVHYDLASVDGYKCTVPEALLTKHVVVV